jgi:hypothetical protein
MQGSSSQSARLCRFSRAAFLDGRMDAMDARIGRRQYSRPSEAFDRPRGSALDVAGSGDVGIERDRLSAGSHFREGRTLMADEVLAGKAIGLANSCPSGAAAAGRVLNLFSPIAVFLQILER